jgi:hydrophobic/amphiphilic exporter-1 (mainly G- bacteria), HAE1 family
MNFIQFSIRNPVKISVAVLLTVMFGMISLLATPVRLTPDVSEPEATVTTRWPGASAQEVEREIIEEQEAQLKSVEGLREFKSESSDSQGRITLKFEVGTKPDDARAKVADKLNQVPDYPENAKEPTVSTGNTNSNAIAWFILKPVTPTPEDLQSFVRLHPELKTELAPMLDGTEPIDLSALAKMAEQHTQLWPLIKGKNDPSRMRKFAEDVIEARFERVDGISNANVYGGREIEFRVTVNPARLAAFRLTISDLRRALEEQNKNTSGGDLWEGKQRNVIRTIGQFDSPEQVSNTIITQRDNGPIRVSDVAEVGIHYKKPDGVVRQKGLEGLAVNAQQAPDTNVLQIMGPSREKLDLNGDGQITQFELAEAKLEYGDCLRIAAEELNIGFLKQKGLRLEQVYDQTDYINSATELVEGNIIWGGLLAIAVLLFFLRSPRTVIIVGLTIPISVIGSFLFVRGFGRSINVISLAGMAFAVGMVVDNAIVVLENIYRHYQNGADPERAARDGASEVWGAVLASTLTTLAVFVPVIFVQGQAGQLFRDIAIAISCGVGLSLIVSITVIPTAARRILRAHTGQPRQRAAWQMFGLVKLGTWFSNSFANAIGSLQETRGSFVLRSLIVLLFVAGSIGGTFLLMPQTEYLPEGNRNLVIAILLPPPGYNVNHMIEIGKTIEAQLSPHWEAKAGSPEEARLPGPRVDNFFFVARGRSLFMGARSVDPLRAAELVPVMRSAAAKIPGMIPIVTQASLFESALSGGRTIEIEITGPDLETLVAEGQKIFGMCMQEFPPDKGNQLRPIPSLDLSSPEFHILPYWEKAAELGMSSSELGYSIDALVDGAYAGDYWHDGQKIDLVLFGAEGYAKHSQDLKNLPLSTPMGKLVTLSTLADVKMGSGPEQVNHVERLRAITIQVKPAPDYPLEAAMKTINEKIRLPMLQTAAFEDGQYQIRMAGTADKLDQTRRELQWNLVLALVITYLLMAALFESFLYPMVIMTSIILALVGGFGGLAVLNAFIPQSLDMLTMLGFVILIGTVVNNAILIVHQALNHMRNDGMDDRAAIVESVRTRIRPIFMSTLTTVLGMLPLVMRPGAGSELYRGLGSVVLGGLIVSTAFTLILVPVGFSLALDIKRMLVRLLGLSSEAPQPASRGTFVASSTDPTTTDAADRESHEIEESSIEDNQPEK